MSNSPTSHLPLRDELVRILDSAIDREGHADSWTGPSADRLSPTDGTFPGALVLSAIGGRFPEIDGRIAPFLRSQLGTHATLNYWRRGSSTAQARPFPDDFDASACALLGLRRHAGETEPEHLAGILLALLTAETAPGGPYRTWFVNQGADEAWKDVDVAVNANIAAFLAAEGSRLDGLDAYLEAHIGTPSPYYEGLAAPMYFLARADIPRTAERIRQWALDPKTSFDEPADIAWQLSAALRSGASAEETETLALRLEAIPLDRWRNPSRVCVDPMTSDGSSYAWSTAVAAASGIEALDLLEAARQKTTRPPARTDPPPAHRRVADMLVSLGPDISALAADTLRRIAATDADGRLTSGVRRMAQAAGWDLPEAFFAAAEDATVAGWAAYTLFDDALDGDLAAQKALPAATVLLRRVGQAYASVLPAAFQSVVHRLLDRVDAANAWEIRHAREAAPPSFPADPSWLGERSIAHATAFIAAFVAATEAASDDPHIGQITEAFLHALAARQIDDDLHDWQEDLSRGRWTPVNAELAPVPPADRVQAFWQDVAPKWTAAARHHADRAEAVCAGIPGLGATIAAFVAPIRSSCAKADRERERTLRFLAAYRGLSGAN
jgi:hypothetical protein